MPSLMKKLYQEKAVPALQAKFKYSNPMEIPAIEKVVINVGAGIKHDYNLEMIAENLKKITGQAPVTTQAKKSISNFKLRQGQTIGLKVTLRGNRMYEFLDRLVHATLPRVHDFRGLSPKAFDKQGNYTIGMKDQLAFPEVKAESIEQLHGLEIVLVTSAKKEEEGLALLTELGFPLKEKK